MRGFSIFDRPNELQESSSALDVHNSDQKSTYPNALRSSINRDKSNSRSSGGHDAALSSSHRKSVRHQKYGSGQRKKQRMMILKHGSSPEQEETLNMSKRVMSDQT